MEYGLLINYAYCTGCHSCEFACRNEKNLSPKQWGIKVFDMGPWEQGGRIEWNYLPAPSELCDLCDERVKAGKDPSCVHHCLAQCMEYGPIDKLRERMAVLGKKTVLYLP